MPIILWILAIGTFAIGTDAFIIAGVLSEIAADFAVSTAVAGQLVTVFSITYAVFAPIISTCMGSFRRRSVLIVALCLFIGGNVMCATANSFLILMFGRIIAALGAASFTPLASGVAAAVAPAGKHGTALSIVVGGLTVATALGVPIGTMIGQSLGWRITLTVVALLGVIGLLGIVLRLPNLPPAGVHSLRERLSPLHNSRVLITLSVTLLAVTSEHLVYTYVGPVLKSMGGTDRGSLSFNLLVFGIGAVVGNAIAGYATDKLSAHTVLFLAIGGMTGTFLILPSTVGHSFLTASAMFFWGLTGWMYLVPQQKTLLTISGSQGVFAVSLNSSALYLGIALGGALGGILINLMNPQFFGYAAAAIGVGALIVAFVSGRENRHRLADSQLPII